MCVKCCDHEAQVAKLGQTLAWAKVTIEALQEPVEAEYIAELVNDVAKLEQENATLRQQLAELRAENERLKAEYKRQMEKRQMANIAMARAEDRLRSCQ